MLHKKGQNERTAQQHKPNSFFTRAISYITLQNGVILKEAYYYFALSLFDIPRAIKFKINCIEYFFARKIIARECHF